MALAFNRTFLLDNNCVDNVKDDSFREDRQALQCNGSGAVLSLLSNAALVLLHGQCEPWRSKEPLNGPSQRLCANVQAILPTV